MQFYLSYLILLLKCSRHFVWVHINVFLFLIYKLYPWQPINKIDKRASSLVFSVSDMHPLHVTSILSWHQDLCLVNYKLTLSAFTKWPWKQKFVPKGQILIFSSDNLFVHRIECCVCQVVSFLKSFKGPALLQYTHRWCHLC